MAVAAVTANVVILGCGRSGTSIFGELFESLPGFRYFFEPNFDDLNTIDFARGPVTIKVPKAPPGSPMTPGLPFVLADLLKAVPEPRVIFWQVRHPLDAVCSLRPGIEANWSHNPRPPDWEQLLARPLIERCARHWAYINSEGYEAVRDMAVVNRFETMLANPDETARAVCARIGLAGADGEIDAWTRKVSAEKSAEGYEAKHQTRWSRLDHTTRIGRWRENLTSADLRAVRPLIEAAAKTFGYVLPND